MSFNDPKSWIVKQSKSIVYRLGPLQVSLGHVRPFKAHLEAPEQDIFGPDFTTFFSQNWPEYGQIR